ncbi:MAG TPA: MBL fold metallo-hydrolase [Syntrophomonas sp.]|nr:MBL fold metallo-hydrolase [Syntrophomonas sp.]
MKIVMITTVLNKTEHMILRDVPVSSTIIELSDHSLAIVDTGAPDNPDLEEQLSELGYAPSDFKLVLSSHLHLDHIGGHQLFNNARIIVSRQELEYENVLRGMLQDSSDPVALLRSLGRNIAPGTESLAWDIKSLSEEYSAAKLLSHNKQIEFYEDNPILPDYITHLEVPGHSVGSRAIMVHGKKRNVIICGDALYHRDLWRQDLLAGLHYDEDLFRRNAEYISRFPDIIIPGHDRGFDNLTQQYLEDDWLQV